MVKLTTKLHLSKHSRNQSTILGHMEAGNLFVMSVNNSAQSTSKGKKRSTVGDDGGPHKVPKLFPIFAKPNPSAESEAPFRWITPALGPKRTCLHGTNLQPKASPKVAIFDLDGTLIKSTFGRGRGPKAGPLEWQWWKSVVPTKVKEVHDSGFAVVIISNQGIRAAQLVDWKKKIPLIAAALPDVPFHIFAATAKDSHRKPMPGMWYELERIFAEDGVVIDKTSSYYVGDAAGRADDFASTDRKFALNVGIKFYTPEASMRAFSEYFLGISAAPYTLPGFSVSSLKPGLRITPVSPPIVSTTPPELVLFVGLPCLGKSSFYRSIFAPAGYTHINQDTLGSRAKCVKAAEEAMKSGKSCVVDNTNRDKATRKYYIDMAKKLKAPVRCFVFNGSKELAWHNNLYRAYNLPPSVASREPKRDFVPYMAFTSFADSYEEPKVEEGYTEVREVNWVFEGDEEERRHWSMWLQIDGK
ncbi:PNK3P-domain-containing protein [Auriscalpium vulgare]|uniref:PNK3P-domain-containing protein n=1 Tax=Auriscalpium vulgare TaxID=40419 RepID=A0ACB8S630_9AGAM|nr:PNK3P-domain-containing protein [Auriscalpium vulgare]